MHIKFLKHGTGSGQRAVDYLLGVQDHSGKARAGVRVLRGHPQQLADVIDSLNFVHRYTSGVVAWAPDDRPTEAQLVQFIDDFEKVAFAGLDAQRYCWSVIEHRYEQGGVHLHVLSARVDLETGKSFNIAPPGWQKSFDPLRDYYNFKYGWTRPDDPTRARVLQLGFRGLKDAAAIRQGLEVEPDPRLVITDFLLSRIELGLIENRDDILNSLLEIAEVSRCGKNYISIKPEGFDRSIRLKGAIYEQQFSAAAFREAQAEEAARPTAGGGIDSERADRAYTDLQHAITRRARYNTERYSSGSAVSEHFVSAAAVGLSRSERRESEQVSQLSDGERFVPFRGASFTGRGFVLVSQIPRRADTTQHATSDRSDHSAGAAGTGYIAALQGSDHTQPTGGGFSAVSGGSTKARSVSESDLSRAVVAATGCQFGHNSEVNQHEYRNPDPAVSENSADRSTGQSAGNAFDRAFRAASEAATAAFRASRKLNESIKQLAAAVAQRISRRGQSATRVVADRSSTPLDSSVTQPIAPTVFQSDPGQ